MKENQTLLTFADKYTKEYVDLVCLRKGTTIENYVVDNFDWDQRLECVEEGKVKKKYCKRCDYADGCPDVKK